MSFAARVLSLQQVYFFFIALLYGPMHLMLRHFFKRFSKVIAEDFFKIKFWYIFSTTVILRIEMVKVTVGIKTFLSSSCVFSHLRARYSLENLRARRACKGFSRLNCTVSRSYTIYAKCSFKRIAYSLSKSDRYCKTFSHTARKAV